MISKLKENFKKISTTTGKYFLTGYLAGKVLEYSSGRKTSYSLPLGTGLCIAGTLSSCTFQTVKDLVKKVRKI